jgi:hypothetical protein
MGVWKHTLDISSWSKRGIDFVKQILIETSDLGWDEQELLLNMGKNDLKVILDVFRGRMERDQEIKRKKRDLDSRERYDAIPFHLNDDLKKHISEHSDYTQIVGEWTKKTTSNWSIYNWDLSRFLQGIGVTCDKIILDLIENGNEKDLEKAANLMASIDGGNIDLCIEIIRRTDNKKIIGKIDSILYSTGLVSGEYGISQAYEAKANYLEKYKEDASPRVRNYVVKSIDYFIKSAENERKRVDEERQLRKTEFEG